jgi:hypothetical protein
MARRRSIWVIGPFVGQLLDKAVSIPSRVGSRCEDCRVELGTGGDVAEFVKRDTEGLSPERSRDAGCRGIANGVRVDAIEPEMNAMPGTIVALTVNHIG